MTRFRMLSTVKDLIRWHLTSVRERCMRRSASPFNDGAISIIDVHGVLRLTPNTITGQRANPVAVVRIPLSL